MADVKFQDFTIEVKGAIDDKINAVLEECAAEMESAIVRNQDRYNRTSKTSGSWEHKVVDSEHTAYIGSNYENAIWEEYGTGEYALPEGGGGRSGYWVFVKGSGGSKNPGKSYTLKEAKKVMAMLRSDGLDAYYTKGKKPRRHAHKAYTANKNKIIKRIQDSLKGL